MNKQAVVDKILANHHTIPKHEQGVWFAPANIALCKYWGKRNTELNLPYTSSLSVSLGDFGAKTTIMQQAGTNDTVWVNGELSNVASVFSKKVTEFLNLFRFGQNNHSFLVQTHSTVPIGAGLASSAAGFAALVGALNALYGWELSLTELSILARLGSGSASRSFWKGFVEWEAGVSEEGMDSIGIPLSTVWPELRIGLMIFNRQEKPISSRVAMENTVKTSPFYAVWPQKQVHDLAIIKEAILKQDFTTLGETVESNALSMHALMLSAMPPILYSEPATVTAMNHIWQRRQAGLPVYFTQDAGPNLKLLFLAKDQDNILKYFPGIEIIAPFAENENKEKP